MSYKSRALTERDKKFIEPFGGINSDKLLHQLRGHIQNLTQYGTANSVNFSGVIEPLGEAIVLIEESARLARVLASQKKEPSKPVVQQPVNSEGLSRSEIQQLKNLLGQLSVAERPDEDEQSGWRGRD